MARILMVEDEPLIALMLAEWLTELGHEPIGPASSVSEAIGIISAEKLDAAIVDINLRGDRCDLVAEELARRTIPFVFATGGDADSFATCFASYTRLLKPYNFKALSRAVDFLCKSNAG